MSTGLFKSKQFKLKKNLKNIVISGPLSNTELQLQQQQQHQPHQHPLSLSEDLHHHQLQIQVTSPLRKRLSSLAGPQQSPSHSILHKHNHRKSGKQTGDGEEDPLQVILFSKYAFVAESPRELSIQPRQFLRLLEKCGNGWLKVCELEDNLRLGLVPASYLDIAINDITRPITLEWLHEFKSDDLDDKKTKLLIPTDSLIDEIYKDPTTKKVWFCVKMQYDLQIIYAKRNFEDFISFNESLSDVNVALPQWALSECIKLDSTVISQLKQICNGLNRYLQTVIKQARHNNHLQQNLHAFIFEVGNYINVDTENHIEVAIQELSPGSVLIDKITPPNTGSHHEFAYSATAPLPAQEESEHENHDHKSNHRRKSEQLFNTSPRTPIYKHDEHPHSTSSINKAATAPSLKKSFRHSASAAASMSTPQQLRQAEHQANYTYSGTRSPSSLTSATSPSRRLVRSRTTSRVFKIPDQPELEAMTTGDSIPDSIPQSVSSNTLMSYTSLFDQYEGDEEEDEVEEDEGNEARDVEENEESKGSKDEVPDLPFNNMNLTESTVGSSTIDDITTGSRSFHYSHNSSQSQSSHNSNYSKINRRTDSTSNSSIDSHRLSMDTKETTMDNHFHTKPGVVHKQKHEDLASSSATYKEGEFDIDPLSVVKPRKLSATCSEGSLMDLRQNHIEAPFSTPPATPLTPSTLSDEVFESAGTAKFEKPTSHHHIHPIFQRKPSSANVTLPLQQTNPLEHKRATSQEELDDEIKPLNVKKHVWSKKTDNLTQLEPRGAELQSHKPLISNLKQKYQQQKQEQQKQQQQQQGQKQDYIKVKIFLQNSSNDVIVLKLKREKLTTTNYVKLKLSSKIYHDASLTQHYSLLPLLLHNAEEKKKRWTDGELLEYIQTKDKCNLKLVRNTKSS